MNQKCNLYVDSLVTKKFYYSLTITKRYVAIINFKIQDRNYIIFASNCSTSGTKQFANASTNSWIFLSELPPSSIAFLITSLHLFEFLRISSPTSPSITRFMHGTISSSLTNPSSSAWAHSPTRHTSATNLAFVLWSVHCGTPTIGIPRLDASIIEFHPQCVMKHPTALWANTRSCVHHDTTNPCLDSQNPLGSLACSDDLTTHKKGLVEDTRALASSWVWRMFSLQRLPNET